MAIQVQRRRGTSAENAAFTGAVGEITYDTDDKRLHLHDGATLGGIQVPNYEDVQNQEYTYALATGTNTIAVTLAKSPGAYAAGQKFSFKAANTTTGAATINFNAIGALTLKKKDPSSGTLVATSGGEVIGGGIYDVHVLDGSNALLESVDGGGGYSEISSQDISGSPAAIVFTGLEADGIYECILSNIAPASDATGLRLRLSSDGGSSYISSSNYKYAAMGITEASGTLATRISASDNHIELATSCGNAAGETVCGKIVFYLTGAASKNPRVTYELSYQDSSGNLRHWTGSGSYNASFAVNAVQISFGTGNFANVGNISMFKLN